MAEKELLTVSAKRLGWLSQPDFCPRCFYVKHRAKWKTPWGMGMPLYGILDRAQKRYITEYIDEHHRVPEWMVGFEDVVGHIEPPHYKKFFFINKEHQVLVRGAADLILEKSSGRLIIVDLKTAKNRGSDDAMAATYHIQQNAYTLAAQEQVLGKVDGIKLLYMSAHTGAEASYSPAQGQAGEMVVPFTASTHDLKLDPDSVHALCGKYRELCEMTEMPAPYEGCKDCAITAEIAQAYAKPVVAQASAMSAADVSRRRKLYAQIGIAR